MSSDVQQQIADATKIINENCNGSGKWKNGWESFGVGILAMFGLGGIPSLKSGAVNAQDLLTTAQNTLQNVTNTSTIYFAQQNVQMSTDLLNYININNQEINYRIQAVSDILSSEVELVQIEVLGAYIILLMIFVYLLYT